METVTIGVDVGQVQDPTAIAVAELQRDRYVVRFTERLPLGTAYPAVAERLGDIHAGVVERLIDQLRRTIYTWPERLALAREHVWVLVDQTGVGRPVVDLLRQRTDVEHLTGVSITAGEGCAVNPRGKQGSVSKSHLVSRLQALIQSGRIALPETPEARALAEELLAYEIRAEGPSATFGAFKVGTHDDLVTALGLAVLLDADRYQVRKATVMRRA